MGSWPNRSPHARARQGRIARQRSTQTLGVVLEGRLQRGPTAKSIQSILIKKKKKIFFQIFENTNFFVQQQKKQQSKKALKNILQKCVYLPALEPLLHDAPPNILKHIVAQFSKVLPHDPKARKLFVTSGGLKKVNRFFFLIFQPAQIMLQYYGSSQNETI